MEQAASKNFPDAQYSMGYMYATGQGLQKDEAKAKQWLTKASPYIHKEAKFNRNTL
jgi:TPR repeat protein